MERTNKDLQNTLDINKWIESEKAGRDLCGEMDYCAYCRMNEDYVYTCARAVRRMLIAERKAKTTKK
ncbi:MAG: hypothetical protein J6V83_01970 [Clostridia bacterium]|nr:hypothetical protein [Clostridia bacterium]MBO7156151.1 hypothetical protein [Clostridia bacterium]